MPIKKIDLLLQDDAIAHQINLLRFTAGEKKKVLSILNNLQGDLKKKMLSDLTVIGRARVNKLLRESRVIVDTAFEDLQKKFDFVGLADVQAKATAKSLSVIGLGANLPTDNMLKALVNGSLIEGAPSAAWWKRQSDDLIFKFASEVRQGMAANETVQQIVKRVLGSEKLGIPGIMDTSRRGAAALVHTSIQQVANDARMATFKENSNILKGVMQLSTLDSHTTKICIAYSGQSWDLNGKPINGSTLAFNGGPPRHFNCRSVLTPITKTYKELGIDAPEVDPGTRASDEGPVKADITMEKWLKDKPTEYVDDLLGPGRSKLFLDGKITLPQLVDQSGRELSLKQLRAL